MGDVGDVGDEPRDEQGDEGYRRSLGMVREVSQFRSS
jgi:hypothetical protein